MSRKWRKWWYIAGSAFVVALLMLLAHGPNLNTVSMDLRSWKLSCTRTEQAEREGRIRITKAICVGPVTYRMVSFDSTLARAERAALP